MVNQVQFLDPAHIEQLRHIVSVWKIPVIAYGLRTDFRTNFFPGSSRLMELADNIEEVNYTWTGSMTFWFLMVSIAITQSESGSNADHDEKLEFVLLFFLLIFWHYMTYFSIFRFWMILNSHNALCSFAPQHFYPSRLHQSDKNHMPLLHKESNF